MRYLGISRAEIYSPNRVSGDAAVLHAVAAELEHHGNTAICMTEDELIHNGIPQGIDGIFQMARSKEALDVLRRADVPVTNTVQAVVNCGRAAQTKILQASGLIPESVICLTTGVPEGWDSYPCWVKRPDSHAVEQDDVRYVRNRAECASTIQSFAERGIRECVLQSHAKGWIVKFYGVRGFGLADCYAASARDGKFGLEIHNDQPQSACVDMELLVAAAERASDLLGVDVYGGDAVVADDGGLTIIDFNDWPSFRTCTVGAAQKIAELIMNKNR